MNAQPMLRVDFGGAGKGGDWLTVNLDGDGNGHPVPDIVADITAAANQLVRHFKTASIDEAQCIATLEHLIPWNVLDTLVYWRAFLRPNARLLIVVPDMRAIFEDYRAGKFDADILSAMIYGPRDWQWRTPWENHRWGWDCESLTNLLLDAGYHDVRRIPEPGAGFFVGPHRVEDIAMEAFA